MKTWGKSPRLFSLMENAGKPCVVHCHVYPWFMIGLPIVIMNDSFRVPAKDTGKGRQIDPVRQPAGQINDGLLEHFGDLTTESGLQICSFI